MPAPAQFEKQPWVVDAACVGVDPDLFFPQRGESSSEAKRVCAACPVRVECLGYAMTPPFERFGVWGGMSERQRRVLRDERRRARRARAA